MTTDSLPAKTFADFDKLQRKEFADRLTTVITKFSQFYDEAFVLSLNASYGSGKTTFLEMWKHQLQADGYKVIYINAWEADFYDEPIVHIINSILNEIEATEPASEKFKAALAGMVFATAYAINSVIDKSFGFNIKKISDKTKEDLNNIDRNISKIGSEISEKYNKIMECYNNLRETIAEYAETIDKSPLIIFVDELDRARPNYSIKFLEAIKHTFSAKGICFVIAVDRDQLKASTQQIYGNIDFENYYKRFITREASLPMISKVDPKEFIENLYQIYIENKRNIGIIPNIGENDKRLIIEIMSNLCKKLGVRARQTTSAFRVMAQIISTESQITINIRNLSATAILVIIMQYDQYLYHGIGNGTINLPDLYEKYSLAKAEKTDITTILEICKSFIKNENETKIKSTLARYISASKNAGMKAENLYNGIVNHDDEYMNMTTREKSKIQEIYERLEEWRPFMD